MNIVVDGSNTVIMYSTDGVPSAGVGQTVIPLNDQQAAQFLALLSAPNGGVTFNGVTFTALPFVPPIVLDPSDTANLSKLLKAILLVMSAWSGKTPAQAKAAFLAAWNSLP